MQAGVEYVEELPSYQAAVALGRALERAYGRAGVRTQIFAAGAAGAGIVAKVRRAGRAGPVRFWAVPGPGPDLREPVTRRPGHGAGSRGACGSRRNPGPACGC